MTLSMEVALEKATDANKNALAHTLQDRLLGME
jgi:hypothetical protein